MLSRDEHDPSGAVQPKVVQEVFVGKGLAWQLQIAGRVIKTTGEHPFYVKDRGWVACHELLVGDLLASENCGWLPVERSLDTGEWVTLYNFRVADSHTYFMGSDEWGFSVWVHNVCYFHYTNAANFAGIIASQLIRANSANKVYVTPLMLSPQQAENILFIGVPKKAGYGDFVVEFEPNPGECSFLFRLIRSSLYITEACGS